jgi:hypothetical protein
MRPASRKLLFTAHLVASLGWVGALAVFFAHALAAYASRDEHIVRAASLAMGMTAWFVILPLSIATLGTGLAQALGTAWGLLRHYWIAFKLVLTVVATLVLLLKLAPISQLATAASDSGFSISTLPGLRGSLVLHAGGGLAVLVAAVVLAVYKPAGVTHGAMPRWARIFGTLLIALLLLVALMLLGGRHGPGMHTV